MSNELNIGNSTKNCTVENILHEGNVNVTDDRDRSRVRIGDRVEGVSATNVYFHSNFRYRSVSSSNEQPSTSSQYIDSIRPHGDGAQNAAFVQLNIGNNNQNVTAKILENTVNVAKRISNQTINAFNVLPKTEQRPICFRYQPPVHGFIGREEDLEFLKAKLCIENPQIIVVSGLGGIGKTQLVKKFIEENRKLYRNIVWINSQRKESVAEEFKVLAGSELEILLNVDGKERDFRTLISMIFAKLSTAKTVLVFDNVDKIDTLEIVQDIVAAVVKPHILITSRIQEFSKSMICRKLEVFSPQEALDYISTNLGDGNDNESPADKKRLADTLMNLPLGLRQATGHIRYHGRQDRNYKICNYISEFNEYREYALSSKLFQNDLLNQYRDTIFTTWKVTMDAIKASEPQGELALRILQIMAYFDSVDIVREIFFNLEGLPSDPKQKEREVISSVSLICNYSMVDDSDHQSVLSIHKLVQEVIQIQLESEQRSEPTLRDGLQLISKMEEHEKFKVCLGHGISVYLSALRFRELVIEFDTYPSMILENLAKWGNYLRAFRFGNEISEQFTTMLGVDHPSVALFKVRIATSYGNLGKHSEALQMYEEVLLKRKIILGEDHPDTITTKHNIARSYNNMGKWSEALQMYEEVLAKRKIILGEDHPDTIITKHNIASLYNNLGKYTEALPMYEEVLAKTKIILGEDHPYTFVTKHNIANSYNNLGKYSEALRMCEEVLAKRKIILGEDHPDTIATKDNIARSYNHLGKHSEALRMYEEILAKMKIILGEYHPDTITIKHNIARSYNNLGKHCEALQMCEEVLEKQKIILGEDHPDTIATKDNIASLYYNLGKHSVALRMYEEILAKRKIILGEDHPDTITTKDNIARSYNNMGKHSEALEMYEEVLAKRKIILGEDHPDTIATKDNIASLYFNLGKYSEALRMYEEILAKRKIILGEDHPDTITTKHNTASSYDNLGKHSEALQMYEEVLAKRKIILGEDHPNTITTKDNIARSYNNLGKHSVALQMFEEVLEKQKIILGEDHPDTITTKHNIARSYDNLGKYTEALKMYEEVLAKTKNILGEDHSDTIVAKSRIGYVREKLKVKNRKCSVS